MYKILVVEDNFEFQATLIGTLTDAGYETRSALNDGQALSAIVEEPFDAAVMDVRLHEDGQDDVSGLSLALAFRGLNPRARIIILSGYPPDSDAVMRAIRYLGGIKFIQKGPDLAEQLLGTIGEFLRARFNIGDETKLSMSLATGQCLLSRAQGRHVCSVRTPRILQVDVERYGRRTDVVKRSSDNKHFQIEDIGRGLWHDIFDEHPEVMGAYREARGKGGLLSFLFETNREYLRLPIEFTHSTNPSDYLVLQHPLSRFLCDVVPKREVISPQLLALTKKLRVLIIASNTESIALSLPRIDGVDTETKELLRFLKEQKDIPVEARLIPTERATYQRVRTELNKTDYDIVHYAGHGVHNAFSPDESCLYFWEEEKRQGRIVPMKASELNMLLGQSHARLVYLSSCYGTAAGSTTTLLDDDFLGLADAVAQAGIPSVLGFRWPVTDSGACQLAQSFYRSLLEQGSLTVALWLARREVAALNKSDTAWLTPVLIHQE